MKEWIKERTVKDVTRKEGMNELANERTTRAISRASLRERSSRRSFGNRAARNRQVYVHEPSSLVSVLSANNLFLSATAGEKSEQWGKETGKGIKGKGAKGNREKKLILIKGMSHLPAAEAMISQAADSRQESL